MKVKFNIKKLLIRLVLIVLIGLIGAFFILHKMSKKYGYSGAKDVVSTYFTNRKLASQAKPTTISLKIAKKDFEFIKEKRKIDLDRGVQVNEGNNYVACNVTYGNDSSVGVIRLKGHMTDHLQDNKWSYRIKTENNLNGMYRFTLQHPGTRNYIYEWVYHQLLANEGVINLFYDFVKVNLNDEDLGIYALEEHFGQHILERNKRPKGVIIRWNPTLYWQGRMNQYHREYVNETYSEYISSYAEPYDKGVMKKDPELIENYLTISKQLQAFRTGKKSTSEVFDVDKMAKFHAIIDLVGGHHSLDWSDVKLYYNSSTKKIEPVGYESFSIRKTEKLAGQQVYTTYDSLSFEYHTQLFKDPVFFEAYIQNLERIASKKYLADFIAKNQEEFDRKLSILSTEWPYRKFDFEPYFENVRLIQLNLQLPKPIHAFVQKNNRDSLVLSLAPVSDFPLEIIGVKKKGKTFATTEEYILPPKARNTVLMYQEMTFEGNFEKIKKVVLLAKIPGSSSIFEVELATYPKYKNDDAVFFEENLKIDTSLMQVEEKNISFKSKTTILDTKVVIPKGYTLSIYPGQELTVENQLIVNGKIESHGYENNPCKIKSIKNGSIILSGKLTATHTLFSGEEVVFANESNIDLYQCIFYDITNTFLHDFGSVINFNRCSAGNVASFAQLNESDVTVLNCVFKNGTKLFGSNSSVLKLKDCFVDNYHQVGDFDFQTQYTMWRPTISNIDTLFVLKNASSVLSFGGFAKEVSTGFVLKTNDNNLDGTSTYHLNSTTIAPCKNLVIKS